MVTSNNDEDSKTSSEANDTAVEAGSTVSVKGKKDPPPVFVMPDGMSYLHVNRNGLIFGCSTDKNSSPCTVIEVRIFTL